MPIRFRIELYLMEAAGEVCAAESLSFSSFFRAAVSSGQNAGRRLHWMAAWHLLTGAQAAAAALEDLSEAERAAAARPALREAGQCLTGMRPAGLVVGDLFERGRREPKRGVTVRLAPQEREDLAAAVVETGWQSRARLVRATLRVEPRVREILGGAPIAGRIWARELPPLLREIELAGRDARFERAGQRPPTGGVTAMRIDRCLVAAREAAAAMDRAFGQPLPPKPDKERT